MARTSAGAALTRQHRLSQLALRAQVIRDLGRIWPTFDIRDWQTFETFTDLSALLIAARREDSTRIAASYFRAFREAERVLEADATPLLADSLDRDRLRTSMRSTGLHGVAQALRAGFSPEAALRQGFIRASGAATRLVLEGGRETIIESVRTDPVAQRWQRITSADPCHFCAMIASRGAVFTEETAGFEAHDHCACEPEPVYPGSREPALNQQFRDLWNETTAGLGGQEAVNAFRAAVEGRAA